MSRRSPARPMTASVCGTGAKRRFSHVPWLRGALGILLAASSAHAQPTSIADPGNDAVIRRTDLNGDGPIDPQTQRLPDIVQIRLGNFSPNAPAADRFDGVWDSMGGFARIDIVLDGLINPPGPLGWDDEYPMYDPFMYGPHPIFGYIEFDLDGDEDTGGELSSPQYRYLGNVARFGGLPSEARFLDRAALHGFAFDNDVTTAPFVDRSGEEFHLAFIGEEVSTVHVEQESPGGDPAIFEAGETWEVEGELFHRAHGFEDFSLSCFPRQGKYEPKVYLLFAHDVTSDTTTISLVYPLQNAGSAALISPTEPVQPNNGCDRSSGGGVEEQNSIEEALDDLQFSATFADPFDRTLPNFQLIAGWEFNSIAASLDAAGWRVAALVGTAYGVAQPDGSRFAWTDVYPNARTGDFNADNLVDNSDVAQMNAAISAWDGDPLYDEDGNATNGSLDWPGFAADFCVYNTNYDGFVDAADAVVIGDLDLDQAVDVSDIDDFIQALIDPGVYTDTHNGADPVVRGDLDGDGNLNGADIEGFVSLILGP